MNHLQLAHRLYKEHLSPEETAIDATCGNGHDTLFLASLLTSGKLYAYDIQEEGLLRTKKRLSTLPPSILSRITLMHASHEDFSFVPPPVSLIVYNLGYLPGSDKKIFTHSATTLASLKEALKISRYISITCYPHREGRKERQAILALLQERGGVTYKDYFISDKAPSVIFITSMLPASP